MSGTNGVTHADPDFLEHEVRLLRDECARLLGELEGRYLRMARMPALLRERYHRLRAALASIERAARRLVRTQPAALIVGALLAGAAVTLVLARRSARRRSPGLGARIAGLLRG